MSSRKVSVVFFVPGSSKLVPAAAGRRRTQSATAPVVSVVMTTQKPEMEI